MKEREERRVPEELERVAARLQAGKTQTDPLQLDQIKQRVMARCATQPRRLAFMKSRIATIATVVGLIGGTGGALAIADSGSHGGPKGGAAGAQYRPGKGCGDRNHDHTGPPGNPGNTSCPPQSRH